MATADEGQHSSDTPIESPFRVDQSQDEFDLEFFGRIIERSCRNLDILRRQAELLAMFGKYSEALRLDEVLAVRCPESALVQYNLACSQSMTGNVMRAIATLHRAIELGYRDFAHIDSDPDLDPLRDLPEFIDLQRLETELSPER